MSPPAVDVDVDGFAGWVRPHWQAMDRLARRLVGSADAEDVLQEAMAAAWRSRHRFNPNRGSARSWLLAIIANKARDHRRPPDLADEVADREVLGPDVSGSERLDLTAAMARLGQRQRLAVALHYYLSLTVEECSEVMGCSAGTVKSTLFDARKRLREVLGEEYR